MAVPVQAQEAPLAAIKPNLHLLTPSPLPQRRSPSPRSGPSSTKEVWEHHLPQNRYFSSLKSTTTPLQVQTRTATPIPSPVKGLVDTLAHLPVSAHSLFSSCITQSQHLLSRRNNESLILRTCVLVRPDPILSLFLSLSEQRLEAWCSFVKYVEISHQGSTMVSMHVKVAR